MQSTPSAPHTRPVIPTTMTAITRTVYGGPEVMGVRTIPVPTPDPGQVLLAVTAAGVDRGALHVVTGRPYLVRLAGYGVRRPRQTVAGHEVAGRVVAVGDDVDRVRLGDRVFGTANGAYAEYALADATRLTPTPDGVTDALAAASAVSGGAALEAVDDLGRVSGGMRVLAIGASGGVGSHAVQLAASRGATVTGVSSAAKADLVRSLGADHVVAYDREPLDAAGSEYDVVLSIGGLTPVRALRRLLTADGTLVIVGGEGGGTVTGGSGRMLRAALWSPFVGQRLTALRAREHHEVTDRLAVELAAGTVVPRIDRTIGLADVPAAFAALAAGTLRGKAVVAVGEHTRGAGL